MKLKAVISFVLLIQTSYFTNCIQAQTKAVVVEHFTNTRCIICAGRNPGFFNALRQNPDVIHIAYHPSSPYRDCLFSKQNPAENDARTRYYEVYGGTPTFMINGNLVSSNEVQNPNIFNQFKSKTSPFKVSVALFPDQNDSISVSVQVEALSDHNYTDLSLYIPFVEDTVQYLAPNGESVHHNVFRKSFTGANPVTFLSPKKGGKAFTYNSKIGKNSLWDLRRMRAVAILSDSDKITVQAERSALYNETLSSSGNTLPDIEKVILCPNPVDDILQIKGSGELFKNYELFNLNGKAVLTGVFQNDEMSILMTEIPRGLYILKLKSQNLNISEVLFKQ